MEGFSFYQPTKLYFGCGRLAMLGELAASYGKSCLLVTLRPGKSDFEGGGRPRRTL